MGGSVSIPIEKMILFRTTIERDNPEGKSVLRSMWKPYYIKSQLEEIEAISAERLGSGFPVFYLGEDVVKGDDADSDVTAFGKIARNIRVDEQMGLVIPYAKMGQGMAREGTGVIFELVSPPAKGNISFGEIIRRYEQRIAMVGLAQFIHLGMDQSGSEALADVTTDFFQLAVAAWADSIADTINRFLVEPLLALNGMNEEDHPIIQHGDISTPNLGEIGDYINKTVGAQVITPDDRLEDTLRRVAGFPSKDESTSRDVMTEQDGDGGQRISRKEKAQPANNQRNQNPTADKPREAEEPEAKKPMRAGAELPDVDSFVSNPDFEHLEDTVNNADILSVMSLMEKFTDRVDRERQHGDDKAVAMMSQAIELIKTALTMREAQPQNTMPPLTIAGDVPIETFAEAIRIIRGTDSRKEDEKFGEIVKAIRETPVQLHLPEQPPPVVNFQAPDQLAPVVNFQVPETKAPQINVNVSPTPIEVKVESPKVEVKAEVHLPHEKSTTKKVNRDGMGRIESLTDKTKYE